MAYDYNDIVRQWFEDLKPLFVNYIHKNYTLSMDEIYDLYTDSWIEVRRIILEGRATDNKWKALLFTIGKRQAERTSTRRPNMVHVDALADHESFDRVLFQVEKGAQEMAYQSVYADQELQAVLATELSYLPNPCNTILKLYYFDDFSMTEIARSMNYSSSRSAITTKQRCLDKLKKRVKDSVRLLGIID